MSLALFPRHHTRYTRWNPDGSGSPARPGAPPPRPTRWQLVIEWIMFGVVGLLIVLVLAAVFVSFLPSHKIVPNRVAEGFKNDRINIVLFGIGGDRHPKHDDLADSIMLVSLKPSTKQAAVVSIPRDLWVHINGYGTHRINYAHQIGDQSGYPGQGPGLLCDTISRVFDQPIHAYIRIDFAAFEKIIDNLGGIDVYCQHGFYDYLFHRGFSQGWQHLDGKRALAYARYRYVIGSEGDNYARELRQQQILSALRDKLQRMGPDETLKLMHAAATLSAGTKTNLTTSQMVSLYRTFRDIKTDQVRHVSLKPFTEPFNVMRLGDPGEAVRTRSGGMEALQKIEASIFSGKEQISTEDQIQFARMPPPPPRPPVETRPSSD